MNHHAGVVTLAVLGLAPGSLDGIDAGQLAGQCRMQVDDHAGEPAEEAHRQQPHPSGQHDPVGIEPADDVGESGVVVGSRFARMWCDMHVRHSCIGGTLQCAAAGLVGDHGSHTRRQPAVGAGVEDGLQIGAAA